MKCIILGSTGFHPNASRHTACYFLPEIGLAMDAGTGFYRIGDYLRTNRLDIFLSHVHLDHVVGLSYLSDILAAKPLREVCVYGEPEKLVALEHHLFSELLFPEKPNCRFVPIPEIILLPNGGRLRWCPLRHRGGSIGFRAEWNGHSMAYITDTVAADNAPYLELIQGVNLLIHECYFPDSYQDQAIRTGHSVPTAVAKIAKAAGVERCVLVHVNPQMRDEDLYQNDALGVERAKAFFPFMEIGRDFQELEF